MKRVMFSAKLSKERAEELTDVIVEMLQDEPEIEIRDLSRRLNIEMISLPWGVGSPFAYIFKEDQRTWCCLKPQYRKRT
jgi:hypothetical protein